MLAQTPGSTYAFARGSAYLGRVASGAPPAGPPVRLRPRCPLPLWRASPHEQASPPAGPPLRRRPLCPLPLCRVSPHERAYGRADEARRVADRVDEVALVG